MKTKHKYKFNKILYNIQIKKIAITTNKLLILKKKKN